MKCFILEDELSSRMLLKDMLENYFDAEIVWFGKKCQNSQKDAQRLGGGVLVFGYRTTGW